ncbi:MAG: Na/Pi symporter [Bacillota bacterium]
MPSPLLMTALGVVLLLIGITLMPKGLEVLGQRALRKAVTFFTSTPLFALLTGAVCTALVQSSSVITVISIGLINSKAMNLPQGIGVILGANIGTTVTAQIIAFDFPPINPWLILPLVALCLIPLPKVKALGQVGLGLSLIFLGLTIFENTFIPVKESPSLLRWFQLLGNSYLLALFTGIIITAVFQSSSAVIGLTIVLGEQGFIPLTNAIAIILGSNLGTCVTALIASCTGNLDGKRLALAHLLLNSFGILLFFPFINFLGDFISLGVSDLSRQIANSHTFYNIVCSLLILPVIHQFTKLIYYLLPDS